MRRRHHASHLPRPVVDRVVPWVGNDDRAAAFNATELLIRKGCRHILFISSHHSAYTRFDRDKGYRQALEAHGIPADENYSMRRPGIDPTPIETEVMVYDFVQKGLPLDGIIASSEPAALGTLYALKRAGLRVPQDVKIVSFDSTLYSLLTDPPLTSIERNPQSIAQKSCELILQMMRGEPPAETEIYIPTNLVERASTDG